MFPSPISGSRIAAADNSLHCKQYNFPFLLLPLLSLQA
jgi:hypothetical protein